MIRTGNITKNSIINSNSFCPIQEDLSEFNHSRKINSSHEMKVLSPKTSFNFMKGNSSSQSTRNGNNMKKQMSNRTSLNNSNTNNINTSRVYSSADPYWEKRKYDTNIKLNTIKKEREQKEFNEIKPKPTISKRSQQIVKKLINNTSDYEIPKNLSVQNETVMIQNTIRNTKQINNNINTTKSNTKTQKKNEKSKKFIQPKISGADDMYLRTVFQMKKDEDNERNKIFRSLLDDNQNNSQQYNYVNTQQQTQNDYNQKNNYSFHQTEVPPRNNNVSRSQLKQKKIIPKSAKPGKRRAGSKIENVDKSLMNVRQKLNEFYNKNEKVDNYASQLYSNTYNSQNLINKENTNSYQNQKSLINKNEYIHPPSNKQQKSLINNVPSNCYNYSANITENNEIQNHFNDNYKNNLNQPGYNNDNIISQIEDNYNKTQEMHKKIMESIYPDNTPLNKIINSNPINRYREENNQRLQDLLYLKNYADNLNKPKEEKKETYTLTQKMQYNIIQNDNSTTTNNLEYFNQRLKINEQKKQAILSKYDYFDKINQMSYNWNNKDKCSIGNQYPYYYNVNNNFNDEISSGYPLNDNGELYDFNFQRQKYVA